MPTKRPDGRRFDQLRPVEIVKGVNAFAAGSALIKMGNTHVLCTASVEKAVPRWREASGLGWVTAEYDMLPASTSTRRSRNRGGRIDGRTQEIQRLIGRALRAVVDFAAMGQNTIWLDCDVLQADGGTRTAAITGAFVALMQAETVGRKQKLMDRPDHQRPRGSHQRGDRRRADRAGSGIRGRQPGGGRLQRRHDRQRQVDRGAGHG